MTAGYSGTPLAKKLTLKDGMRVWFDGMPGNIRKEIDKFDLTLSEQESPDLGFDGAHIFVRSEASLISKVNDLRRTMDKDGQLWVSWPKKTSGVETEISEHDVRQAGLEAGLVDTKKCAVDEVWSGLKFVVRKADG
ncbi:DUF3052 family protein [Erythrobacter rubeus]|uniref:DUF3052 family protein n=1 Tax=Erythrobacter rubeus TaxID=2760803 RepID=A0ABR8KPZ3_9SPHN|nr:DUF3052 family protein [Erythrobacter rubeus]MBD2841949.1 DUF3052 family protein [Erythrobacter rubeus]